MYMNFTHLNILPLQQLTKSRILRFLPLSEAVSVTIYKTRIKSLTVLRKSIYYYQDLKKQGKQEWQGQSPGDIGSPRS